MSRFYSVCLLAIPCLLSGCGDDKVAVTVSPFDGMSFSVHVPKGSGLANYLEPTVSEWNARTNAKVELVEDGKPSAADIVISKQDEVHRYWASVGVLPREELDRLGWNGMLIGLRERVAIRGREPRLVPLSSPALVCYYRGDLLEAAGLKLPTTWPEYRQLAATLDEWANGLKVVEPWAPEWRTTLFTARSVGYASSPGSLGLHFDLKTGSPRLNTPGFREATKEMQAMAPLLSDCWNLTPAECRRELLQGRAAIGLAFEPVRVPQTLDRGDEFQLRCCRLPGSNEVYSLLLGEWDKSKLNNPGLIGFDGYVAMVISCDDANKTNAACNLLSSLLHEMSSSVISPTRGFSQREQVSGAAALFREELKFDEARSYVAATGDTLTSSHLICDLPILNRSAFEKVFSEILTAESLSARSAEELLSTIDERWDALVDEAGRREFIQMYRWSYGLRATE